MSQTLSKKTPAVQLIGLLKPLCCLLLMTDLATADSDLALAHELFDRGQYEQAEPLFEHSAKTLSADVHYHLALINDPVYHSIAIEPGYPKYQKKMERKAQQHYRQAIDQGHCFARYHYYIYTGSLEGRRQMINNRKAFRNETKACLQEKAEQGDPHATYMLGDLITIDTGEPTQKVMPWVEQLTQLAENGDADAQFYLGQVYADWYFRDHTFRDFPLAFAWYSVAAFQGHFQASYHAMYVFNERMDAATDRKRATELAQQHIQQYGQPKVKPVE